MTDRKKGKRGLLWLTALMLICLGGLAAWLFFKGRNGTDCVTRALAARQTALAIADGEEISAAGIQNFSQDDAENWYVPYAEYLYGQGIWDAEQISADRKTMGGALNCQELLYMAEWLQLPEKITFSNGASGKDPVSKEDWSHFYELLLEKYDTAGAVIEQEILLIGTPNNLEDAGSWEARTDKGVLNFQGLSLDSMVDMRLKVRTKGAELLQVEEVVSEEITYENVWLDSYGSEELKVYLYGTWRKFQVGSIEKECSGMTGDIMLKKGKVTEVALKKETIRGKLLAVGDGEMEIEGYGKVPLADTFHVYRTYGGFAELSAGDLMIGYDQAEFVVAEGKICAALIGKSVTAENIRVLLTDAKIGSIFHETAAFTSDKAFTVTYNEGEASERHEAGESVEINRDSPYFSKGRVRITPDDGGKIGFTSFSRKYGAPWYEGTIELAVSEEGILIINEVDLETYLCYVVPSEMPESYGLEALKAQAVCARSYACRQIEGSAYSTYGAHVDDSTTFQVYNNTETDDLTRQAVEETYGKVLTYGGSLVTTYYYATSCGFGNDMQVWGSDQAKYPYLKSIYMADGAAPDLSSEEAFRAYLENREGGNLESSAPWFRWETTISTEKMTARMDKFLKDYAKSHEELVLFRQGDGSFAAADGGNGPDSIGTVTGMKVEERSQSGFVNRLLIEGTEGAVRIERPGTVRALLGDTEHVYTRLDGSTSTGKTILPSASVWMEEIKDGETLSGWKLRGGGYGHGVGMSQTAASTLAGQGRSCVEILQYFYPGTEIFQEY